MNLLLFNELMKTAEGRLGQDPDEWRCFLEFADAYFKGRGITNPVIVEIGVMNNAQKAFYIELLNADHIGIDANANTTADIVGYSQFPETVATLERRLAGRSIDLLFIDGDHSYEGVSRDYELYERLVRHIIAIHDISHPYSPVIPEETMRFWKEIVATDKGNLHLTIRHHNAMTTGITAGRQMGIGLVIKGEAWRS